MQHSVPSAKPTTVSAPLTPNFFQSFAEHPASVGETYFGHFVFALRFALRLFAAGSAALIHAFIPAWFETTASRQVGLIHSELMDRHSDSDDNSH